ncbi:MAG: ribosome small subunit-dependent GTPase [Haloplasmataceae bacterium]|jgi:ribosome biogenesis GTPase|nr:ribosome small subunit-dependent GTPase [Haloplasmataceae bacterium]
MKSQFGWNGFFEKTFKNSYNDDFLPGRIITDMGNSYKLITQNGVNTIDKSTVNLTPVVGDFVILKKNNQKLILNVLPRISNYKSVDGEVLVANFDTIFIVNALTNLDVKKIEKSVLQAWESGAVPVVVLTKTDLCDDFHNKVAEVKLAAPGVDVFPVSSITMEGMSELYKYLKENKTIAILGSTGEGKSTLINKLIENGNMTVHDSELYLLPNGSLVIDIDEERENVTNYQKNDTYNDIDDIVHKCRFNNCSHTKEPGCAVIKAIEEGTIDELRFNKYLKLQKQESEISLDETSHFDYNKKRNKELYNKGRKKEQW